MGGVLIGINKGIKHGEIKEWKNENESKINLIAIYNHGKIREATEVIREIVEGWQEKGNNILLIGDFNARIGKEQIDRERVDNESKKSQDKKQNSEGKNLLNIRVEIGGIIKNGDTKEDWEGKITYVGEGAGEVGSVLDLVIEIENEKISVMRARESIESDH